MGVDKNSSLISINKTEFGTLKNGTVVYKYTLENKIGTKVSIITYGGIITNLKTFNKSGELEDIVLGYNSPSLDIVCKECNRRIEVKSNWKELNFGRWEGKSSLEINRGAELLDFWYQNPTTA